MSSFLNSGFAAQGRRVAAAWVLILLALPALVRGATLDDFKTAASSDGVNLIPFADVRRDATSIADDVQKRKEEVQSFSYDTLEKQKNNFLKDIKKNRDDIEAIKKEMSEWKTKYSDADTSSFDNTISKRNSAISDTTSKMNDLNDKLTKAADSFDRLNQARAGLREYFGTALDQLSDAKSNPQKTLGDNPSDDDKNKLNDCIDTIKDKINSQIEEHKKQEEGAKTTKEKYQELIKRTDPS